MIYVTMVVLSNNFQSKDSMEGQNQKNNLTESRHQSDEKQLLILSNLMPIAFYMDIKYFYQ